MIHELAKYWWLVVLRGVLAVLFAAMAFIWLRHYAVYPGHFPGGLPFCGRHFRHGSRVQGNENGQQLVGIPAGRAGGIAAGLIALFMPGVTALFLVTLVALWSVVAGILEIIIAIRLRKEITGEWMLIVAGIFSVIFGILLFMQPVAGVVVISWWLGIYALFLGIFLISVGFRLKKVAKEF